MKRRQWTVTYQDEQAIVGRHDGFLSIDTAERHKSRWRSNNGSVAVAWEMIPGLILALQYALSAHERKDD